MLEVTVECELHVNPRATVACYVTRHTVLDGPRAFRA